MSKFISIKEASVLLGVSTQTLRRWERQGKLTAVVRTKGGQRRYDLVQLSRQQDVVPQERSTVTYARVSTHEQKNDLQRQNEILKLFCASHGWTFESISEWLKKPKEQKIDRGIKASCRRCKELKQQKTLRSP
jgi:putative resolvase